MNKQSIKILLVLLSIYILLPVYAFSQARQIVVVKDMNGNPVSGAQITLGEDSKPVYSNERGEFNIEQGRNYAILIEAEGFDPILVKSAGLAEVTLKKSLYQMGKQDEVNVPFAIFKEREIPGAITVLEPKEILKYDQQNTVRGALNGRVPGLFGSSDIRGIGAPLYVINGVPRQGIDINLQEIEQITVLKDLSTMMLYGTQANNGVILITTKRGVPLKREVNFTAQSGINVPISYPKYLSAPEYMELYNESLMNDGLSPRYSEAEISDTRLGTNTVRYPDVDYYNSTYLKDWSNTFNVNGEISGGNEIGQFYLNMGWNRDNGLLAIGEGLKERTDRFNLRSNIDYKVAENINLLFDGAVIFNFSRAPRYSSSSNNFWTLSSTYRPNIYQPLIPADLITNEDLLSAAKLVDNKYVLGGTTEYLTNIYGELTRNGSEKGQDRLIEMNTGLNFDLGGLTEGLTAKAFVSFDMFSMFTEVLMNSYSVYRPNFASDNTINSFSRLGTDVKVHEQTINNVSFFRRYGAYGMADYKRTFDDHQINAQALVFLNRYDENMVIQPKKNLHYGLRGNYMFRNRYIVELTGVYAGSGKIYNSDKRLAFSPGIGLAWIASEENFLKSNLSVNYLKIRANWAINHTDEKISNYRLDSDYFMTSSSLSFNHGGYNNVGMLYYPGNTTLGMEKVQNMNAGFEAMLFDHHLGLEGSYFYNKNYDIINLRTNTLPGYFGALAYENYGSYQRQGIEAGVNYFNHLGDLKIRIGSNLTYSTSELLIWDELKYEDEYRRTVGKATDAIFGYVALGLFKDQADIDNHAVQTFGDVKPGDIKYKDLNGDNKIDERDQMMIGNSKPSLQYGIHAQLTYKNIEFFVLGTGQTGRDRYFNNAYYWVYGDRKYSEVVLNRWTPLTSETANYPRLSSTSNANNFRNSTFWLYESNWFSIHTIQFTYSLPVKDFAGLENVGLFLRGNNVLMLSGIKDKLELNIAAPPQMRLYTIGLKLMF